ncbi:glycosyltransferase family 2 protein [Algoriphagus sp. C2-6-M1]|uniref:glycosyltransferase family 2 protein n=1 Tax=Algoriphagus persicinus TaxID=3108754 RepID=UPI002B37F986|nr:glycosyltransferase family 2 protein [Algoriphagus sp. C2-6-M1]MEB2782489.1 glycosyltransferase family 2 protein [Algoriphagus sp. C2-6-M1]
MNDFLVSIVVPCYNEAENIAPLLVRIESTLKEYSYEVLLVNDGSKDGTQLEIELAYSRNSSVSYISFSRNFGHQAALKAGIDHATGDCIVTMDADLQKPPEAIPEMIALWQRGNDIVTAVCRNEGQSSLFKRLTSTGYYRLLSWLADHEVLPNGADFRLFDRKIADIIRGVQTQNLYLRGIFSWIGYKQAVTYYREEKRRFGKTKYGIWKMINLASNGITSFSVKPLRFALAVGLFFACLAFGYGIYAITMVFLGMTVPGWASLVASIVFLSGIQLMVLGVIGEYIGKMYMELKHRPTYLISKTNITLPSDTQREGIHFMNPKDLSADRQGRRQAMT